ALIEAGHDAPLGDRHPVTARIFVELLRDRVARAPQQRRQVLVDEAVREQLLAHLVHRLGGRDAIGRNRQRAPPAGLSLSRRWHGSSNVCETDLSRPALGTGNARYGREPASRDIDGEAPANGTVTSLNI